MHPDKWYRSLRLYSGILALVGVGLSVIGVDFSPEDQASMAKQLDMLVGVAIPLVSGILALVSKIREANKCKKASGTDTLAPSILLAVSFGLLLATTANACAASGTIMPGAHFRTCGDVQLTWCGDECSDKQVLALNRYIHSYQYQQIKAGVKNDGELQCLAEYENLVLVKALEVMRKNALDSIRRDIDRVLKTGKPD
jgi:hypothetical protein